MSGDFMLSGVMEIKHPFPWEISQVFPSAQLLQQQHTRNLPVSFDNLQFNGYSREIILILADLRLYRFIYKWDF